MKVASQHVEEVTGILDCRLVLSDAGYRTVKLSEHVWLTNRHQQHPNNDSITTGQRVRTMNRRQTILKVFTRKYQLSLTSEAIQFLEEILEEHEVQDEDVQHSVELLAREYSVQDGKLVMFGYSLSALTVLWQRFDHDCDEEYPRACISLNWNI